jgi:organic radical activating enzyme
MFTLKENQEAYRKHFAYATKGYCIFAVMTIRCNYSCSICSYSCTHKCDDEWTITYEVIDAFIEKLKAYKNTDIKPIVCLYGGEPTLELDKCEYLAKKVHELGFPVSMWTNGWWGSNPAIRKRIYDNIKPFVIMLSVDSYHDNSLENDIIPIIEDFKDCSHVIPCGFAGHSKLENLKKLYPDLKVHEDEAVLDMGRAYENETKDKQIVNKGYGACNKTACALKPNGIIGFDCCHDMRNSCNYGSVFDKDFDLTQVYKHFEYYHTFPTEQWCDEHPEFNCTTSDPLPSGVRKWNFNNNYEFKCTHLKYSDLYL